MNSWLAIVIIVWAIYAVVTIHGAINFPAYTVRDKRRAVILSIVVPFLGAYLINRSLGDRVDEALEADPAYKLPWWVNYGGARK